MKKMFAFVVVAMLLLAIPAAAANYKFSGSFAGSYEYTNGAATTSTTLKLALNLDEAGLLTAYVPIKMQAGKADIGWWVKFATEPLNLIISDNTATGYKWGALETTFGLLSTSGVSSGDNFYSKVWGAINPNLSYAAQAAVKDSDDDYAIAMQLSAKLPLGLSLVTDWGWKYNSTVTTMGLSTALTGAIPVIGGKFKVAVGNFADLDMVLIPGLNFWDVDDAMAFAAYAGVTAIPVGPLTIDEVSYKMSMGGVEDSLLSSTSFYRKDLQEVTTNATLKLAPVTVIFKNGVWFQSFNANGGNNANLDVAVALGDLTLGLNLDSKINWVGGFYHAEKAELRADYVGPIGELGGHVGYNANWDSVGKYALDGTKADKVYGGLYYNAPFGLETEAWGHYDQAGTNNAAGGIYAKYENKYTSIPFIVDLNALVAAYFEFTWTEVPTYDYEPIGFVKLDATIDGQWSAGMFFLTKEDGSELLAFDPIVSVYAKYLATDKVTVTGRVTYRGFDLFAGGGVSTYATHRVYAKVQGDIKISDNAKASVYWGQNGYAAVGDGHAFYGMPWGAYYASVGDMYWDTFGANFTIKF